MVAALRIEWLKLRRSPVTLTATSLMVLVLPMLALGFYRVAASDGVGALAQKAQALVVGDGWDGYLGLVDQIVAAAVFVGTGVVVAWVFGREHSDRTFSALFALTVSRRSIAWSKVVVLTTWAVILSLLIVCSAAAVGTIAGVGPIDADIVIPGLLRLLAVTFSTTLLSLTVGLPASVGRGYLPAIGAMVLILMAAQVSVLFGTGGWFPFAVPGLLAVTGGEGVPTPTAFQQALVPLTAAIGAWLTAAWWRRAEVV